MHRLLFVYGTLKQGHPRCKHLSGQRYLGTARTSQSYSMYKVSNSFPGLVEAFTSHPAQRIYWEMYEVDGDCLDILDDIEGVSEGMYKRMDIMVEDMNLSNLPIFSDTFLQVHRNTAECYIYQGDVSEFKNCGFIWLMD